MIRILSKDPNNPPQEYVNSSPIMLIREIEKIVLNRVTEMNLLELNPEINVYSLEKLQRDEYLKAKRISEMDK